MIFTFQGGDKKYKEQTHYFHLIFVNEIGLIRRNYQLELPSLGMLHSIVLGNNVKIVLSDLKFQPQSIPKGVFFLCIFKIS
jgi:carotenoid cleavage dioxygenase-like enzyme